MVYKHAVVAAFRIYAQRGEVTAKRGGWSLCIQAFKWALLFLFYLLFPTFLICSYFSLLFHENALLSLLFHSKMSFTRKNSEIFPRLLCPLGFYKLISMFTQGARRLTPKILMFNLKVSLFG